MLWMIKLSLIIWFLRYAYSKPDGFLLLFATLWKQYGQKNNDPQFVLLQNPIKVQKHGHNLQGIPSKPGGFFYIKNTAFLHSSKELKSSNIDLSSSFSLVTLNMISPRRKSLRNNVTNMWFYFMMSFEKSKA